MTRHLFAAMLVSLFLLIGLAARPSQQTDAQSAGAIVWRDCGDGFECGALNVPLDHRRPRDRTIEIAVTRLQAADPEARIGPLLVNPGGPGGSGLEYARALAIFLPPDLLDRFDLIGFDPRGVGQSTDIDCVDDLAAFDELDGTPDTAAEEQHVLDTARAFGEDCQRRSAELIQYVDTASAARDMDLLREALGEEQITYFGLSYGTFLGATYADLFPERLRGAVLDAALDPSIDAQTLSVQQASLGFDRAFEAFLADCAADPECPFKAPDLAKAYDDLIARIEDAPLTSADAPGQIDDVAALNITAGSLYNPEIGWTLLANALRDALDGDAFGFLVADDGPPGPVDDEEEVDFTNGAEAFSAIACVDLLSIPDEDAYRQITAALEAASPRFGEVFATSNAPCVFWPRAERRVPGPIAATGAPPILVVGTTRDPATPYEWSQALASQMESARLLTYNGDGHVAYGRHPCVNEYVQDYLLTLSLPPVGTVCGRLLDAIPPGPVGPGLLPPGPAPVPPSGVIVPPDTGHGPRTGVARDSGMANLLALAAAVIGLAVGAAVRSRRVR